MSQSATVYLYADQTKGWVISYGETANQEVNDPNTEVLVPLNEGELPESGKPLWKQRVDDGVFGDSTSGDLDAAKIWLSSKFVSGRTTLLEPALVTVLDSNVIVLGSWLSDSRGGVVAEGSDARVFGAIFRWVSPVAGRPPNLVCKGYNPAEELKHTLPMYGEAVKKKNDPTTNYEFWRMVTAKNAPITFRNWRLELDVPTLVGSEQCAMESLRISKGKRGV